jgi:S1-C subfamily serine protease
MLSIMASGMSWPPSIAIAWQPLPETCGQSKTARERSAMPSIRRTARVIALLLLAFITTPALADPADIAAASRSVVRVVIIQNDGSNAQLITHGSGFVVAPDLVVTNAHVVTSCARTIR